MRRINSITVNHSRSLFARSYEIVSVIINPHAVPGHANVHKPTVYQQVGIRIRHIIIQVVGNLFGGFGQCLIDNAVNDLPCKKMVMPLKENRHAGILHDLLNRFAPAGALLVERIFSVSFVAAPFVKRRNLCPAANISDSMMRKDEFVLGVAVFKRLSEPAILRLAERPTPAAVIITARGVVSAVSIRIDGDEQRVAPCKGVIILNIAE